MNALHEQFVVEARELIQQANDDLINAEREGFSEERIDRVFRVFHTLKGSAAVVGLPAMGLVMHAAEDVLSAIQAGRLGATSLVIDQALACVDQVANWVDEFEAHEALSPESVDAARELAEGLRSLFQVQTALQPARTQGVGAHRNEPPDWVADLIASLDSQGPESDPDAHFIAFRYEPSSGCFFDGDDPLDLLRRLPGLRVFRIEARDAPPPLADLDPYFCNLRLRGISSATFAQLSAVFRLLPDQVALFEMRQKFPQAAADNADDAVALARAVLEEQLLVLRTYNDQPDVGRTGSAMRAAIGALRHSGREELAERIGRERAMAMSQSGPGALIAAIEEILCSLAPSHALASDRASEVQATAGQSPRAVSRALRVDEARIDALVDMAGELQVVKNGFAHLAKRAGEEASYDLARAIRDQNESLGRLVSALHGAVVQLRLVPLAQVFRSFPRLVRDLSQQLGKEVTLVTRGEATEADKTIVDLLFEPLMHLVRNALDHGIEAPGDRLAAGKPPTATLTLQTVRRADRLVVEATDDGRGIDPAAIRQKARQKELLPQDQLAALSDEQAIDLIFGAGLSTAAEVSDVSGRGVGMDVVRNTIERIGGRVSVTSKLGTGTTVTIDLPMNIALLRIMVVESGGQAFGIPMDSVSETVRVAPNRISRFKNNEGFVLHDHVVPICSLAELMNLPTANAARGEVRLVVVAEVGGRTTALEVDGIRDRMEVVVKPMQGLLSSARGYAGTTLLGDGTVLLVLDLQEILP